VDYTKGNKLSRTANKNPGPLDKEHGMILDEATSPGAAFTFRTLSDDSAAALSPKLTKIVGMI
jgi:hypothetical protein